MKTVKENITNEIIINKSKFITIITKINSLNDINQILENTKKTYKKNKNIEERLWNKIFQNVTKM